MSISHGILFLAITGLLVPACKRLAVSPIITFLVAGVLLGPAGIGQWFLDQEWSKLIFVTDVQSVSIVAELGVVLLMFMIGLEVSFSRLISMRRLVFGMGGLQILLCALVIGTIAFAFGNNLLASVLLGASLALSSTALILQLLIDEKKFGTKVGQACFAVLLAQDLAVIPILFLISAFSSTGQEPVALGLAWSLSKAALVVGSILIFGRFVIGPMVSSIVATGSAESTTAVALLIIATTAMLTHLVGLSSALGAFLAGLVLSESDYRNEIELYTEPFKGLFLGLFFISVGMLIDLSTVYRQLLEVLVTVIGLLTIKACLMWIIARLYGYNNRESAAIGVTLSQGGEFALVVITLSISFGLIDGEVGQFMLLVTALSMFTYPLIASMLLPTLESVSDPLKGPTAVLRQHVVVVGMGRMGRTVIETLEDERVTWVAIDRNADKLAGFPAELGIQGDARRAAALGRASIADAALLLICIDDHDAVEDIITIARRASNKLPIIARAKDDTHGVELLRAGANSVIPEANEAGLQITETALVALGFPPASASDLINSRRGSLAIELSEYAHIKG